MHLSVPGTRSMVPVTHVCTSRRGARVVFLANLQVDNTYRGTCPFCRSDFVVDSADPRGESAGQPH
jgi:hypothetical protein